MSWDYSLYTKFVKMHQNVHLQLENFIVYELYLDEAILSLKASGLGEQQGSVTLQKGMSLVNRVTKLQKGE